MILNLTSDLLAPPPALHNCHTPRLFTIENYCRADYRKAPRRSIFFDKDFLSKLETCHPHDAFTVRGPKAAVECGATAPLSLTKAELPFRTPKTLRVQKRLPGHSPVILTQNA
jgi:hypothetical protein